MNYFNFSKVVCKILLAFLLFCLPVFAYSQAFITTWQTGNGQITIPTFSGETYNYNLTWTNLVTNATGTLTNQTGDATLTGLTNGETYRVEITGTFPRIYFNASVFSPKKNIKTIEQWGNIAWTSMEKAFAGCVFLTYNAIDAPNLNGVTNLERMFNDCVSFNATNLNNWNTSTITNMRLMFMDCFVFNGNLSAWNTTNVTDMVGMFANCLAFNQNIGGWDTSNVTNMVSVFNSAIAFNQNIGGWNTSNVTNMVDMFNNATAFNQNISGWNTSNVTNMVGMFNSAIAFNQNIGGWNVANVTTMEFMLDACGMSATNYDNTLIGWASQAVQMNVPLGAFGRQYCQAQYARNVLTATKGWNITDDALACPNPFITKWQTTDGTLTIPTTGTGYLYNVAWFNETNPGVGNGSATNQTGDYTLTGLSDGDIYRVEITGTFPRIYFNSDFSNAEKIRSVEQWGDIRWTSMENAFQGCSFLQCPAMDTPNLQNATSLKGMFESTFVTGATGNWAWNTSTITDMSYMFNNNNGFNGNITTWNVSNVTNMGNMFGAAVAFNQNIGGWNVSHVTDMSAMFVVAVSFNQDISGWNTSNVTNMSNMFNAAFAFNQNITTWNTSNVISMDYMFQNASAFNQDISLWNFSLVQNMNNMLDNSGFSQTNYEKLLVKFANSSTQNFVNLGAQNISYCSYASVQARNSLMIDRNWQIHNDRYVCDNGFRGNMLTFDGVNGYATAPYSATLNPSTFTVEAWVKVNHAWANNFRGVISSRENTNGYGYTFYAGSNLNNTWHFWLGYADVSQQINTGVPVVQDAWTHLAASYNGTDLKIYIDGVLVSNTMPVAPPHLNNTEPLFVGSGNNMGTPDFYTACSIDELRIWSVERTLAQIRADMHLTLSINAIGLNAYYQISETNIQAKDAINGNNLTPSGNVTFATSTLSVGKGVSKTVNVTSAGGGIEIDLSTTNFEINLLEASDIPFDDVVITQITAETPHNNLPTTVQTTSCYWVVRNFGDNDGLVMSYIKVKIPNSNTVSLLDETNPANLALYKRATNSASAWTSIGNANSASNTTKEINFPLPTTDSFSEFIVGSNTSPLPITLVRFGGEREERGGEATEEVKLTWETASEINNKGFEIQVSDNAQTFKTIAFVDGAGQSNTKVNYQLSIFNAQDAYYRLKQVDFDGKFSYSPVVFVEGVEGKVVVYPNPNNGTFKIKSPLTPEEGKISLRNAQGIEVPFNTEGNKINISPSEQGASGIYFLHTTVAGKTKVTKVVIR